MSAAQNPVAARRAADAAARALATVEFDRPLVLEAGAGTGKTATLVARVLAWCLGPGWQRALERDPAASGDDLAERVARGVVAITFTEAAAAEMDERIEQGLAALAAGRPLIGFSGEAPAERVVALRGALDHLVVQTIHAWCRRLLAAHPIEAGVHPLFEVDAQGAALEEAVREVAAEQLGAGYVAGDVELLALAERGIGPGEIEEVLRAQLEAGVTARELDGDALSPGRIGALCARLARAHAALETAAEGRLSLAKRSRKAPRVESAAGLALRALAASAEDAAGLALLRERLAEVWGGTARNALDQWRKGDFTAGERDALGARSDAVAEASGALHALLGHLEKLDLEVLARLGPVLARLAAEVEARLRRRGKLGFDGLLERAAALLALPEVAERLREEIDQLLVDEFQDTDPRQCALVAALALGGPPERRPGLFLVGDPKQSIYGWRSADLAAYEGLLRSVREAGGEVLPLSVNHRSVPAVLDAVERAIAPVMRRVPELQPQFETLVASEGLAGEAGFSAGGRSPVELWIPAPVGEDGAFTRARAAEVNALEAAALARDLRALHDEHGVAWRGMGVLFRSRGDWDLYLSALRALDIPYLVEGDRSYYRRREVLDAAALAACALDPNDQLALVALLRSSAAGVPDAAWLPLWACGFPALAARLGDDPGAPGELRALLERVAAEIDPTLPGLSRVAGWQDAAAACLEALAALRASHASEAGDRFVERLRSLTAFEAVESARFLGRWRAANLERFFAKLAADLAEPGSPGAVLRGLRRRLSEEEEPSAEPASLDALDAVSVVTLHGAKGLAWDHVYLVQLHKGEPGWSRRDEAGRVEECVEGSWCGAPTLGRDVLEARRQRVAEAERVRTLYVGMTRARLRLVVSGDWSEAGRAQTHAALIARGAGAGVDPAALLARADSAGRVAAGGWSWYFPARDARAAEAGAPRAAPLPGEARAAAAPAAAAAARARMAGRMARRRSLSVTGLADRLAPEAPPEAHYAARAEGAGAAVGRRVGTALHAALERLDLAGARAEAWRGQRERIAADLRAALPAPLADEAAREALALWDAVAAGPLAARLGELAPRLIARELPVLLPLADDAGAEALAEHASGAIDLLYRDPDGRPVVADFKTDHKSGSAPLAARLASYRRQGELYCRAVAGALGADPPPRFELWWLRTGEVEWMS